jgi:hypothetical protein
VGGGSKTSGGDGSLYPGKMAHFDCRKPHSYFYKSAGAATSECMPNETPPGSPGTYAVPTCSECADVPHCKRRDPTGKQDKLCDDHDDDGGQGTNNRCADPTYCEIGYTADDKCTSKSTMQISEMVWCLTHPPCPVYSRDVCERDPEGHHHGNAGELEARAPGEPEARDHQAGKGDGGQIQL